MLKKVIALIAAAALCAGGSACGNKTAKTSSGEAATITWLMWGDKQIDQASVNEKINEITMSKINAKLDIQYIDQSAYSERMTMNMASGADNYDLCFTGFVNSYKDAAEKGGLLDITDMLDKHEALKKSVPDYFWEGSAIDGRIYAVPNQQVVANAAALCVKKDLADEYGLKLDEIKYIDDIEPFLKWVKEKHPEVYPFRTSGISGYKGEARKYKITSGVYASVDNGKVTAHADYEAPDFGVLPRLYRDWFNKGYIRQDNAVATDDSQDYNAGKFAAWILAYKPGMEAEIYTSKGYEAYCKMITKPYIFGRVGTSTMTGINAKSKNPEKALDMIELIQTDKDLYNLICFGIEGKHYKMENNRVVSDKQAGYMPTWTWRFGNQFNALLIEGQSDNVWEETEKFNVEAERELVGFSFNTKPVRTEVAQLATVEGKYSSMNKGTEDVDSYIDKYIAELKTAGVEKVTAEAQKQIDEFMSKN